MEETYEDVNSFVNWKTFASFIEGGTMNLENWMAKAQATFRSSVATKAKALTIMVLTKNGSFEKWQKSQQAKEVLKK